MKNKGFTLVELLAVITILSILMVIAVPKIFDAMSNTYDSGWEQFTQNAKKAVETQSNIYNPATGKYKYTVVSLCSSKLSGIVDTTDVKITCKKSGSNYKFTLTGKNKYNGKTFTFTCDTSGKCV